MGCCALIPLIKPGKYSGRTSLSRRNSGCLKPAVSKEQRKTAGNNSENSERKKQITDLVKISHGTASLRVNLI
jgi:hypothetical protein